MRFWALETGVDLSLGGVESTRPGGPSPGDAAGRSRTNVFELGGHADPDAILATAGSVGLRATEAAARLSRGCRCVSLLADGGVATTCWVSAEPEWVGELHRWFDPPVQEAYVWDCTTRIEWRGRHYYSNLLREVTAHLSGLGCRRLWIASGIHNWRSARGIRRAGFRPVGTVVCATFLGLCWERVLADPDAPADLVERLKRGLSADHL